MSEFFIIANSFAAPFFSDTSSGYEKGTTAQEALMSFIQNYTHPAGLYAARVYKSADAYHKNKSALAEYLSNHELAIQKAKKGKGSYSYFGHRPGDFEIDRKRFKVKNPKGGKII